MPLRIVIDEDIPRELTPHFRSPSLEVQHVEEIGLGGTSNGALLTAPSGACDIFVTGDTNLGHQQNLGRYDLALVLLHPERLVIDQIKPLIPVAVAAFPTARKHAVTTIGPAEPPERERAATSTE